MTIRAFIFLLTLWLVRTGYAQQLPAYTETLRLYDEALELYDKNLFASAYGKFGQFLESLDKSEDVFSQNDLSANAQYYQAVCAYFINDDDLEVRLNRFLQNYPTHSNIPYVQYCLGMHYFDTYNYKAAYPLLNTAYKSDLFKDNKSKVLSKDDQFKLAFALGYCHFTQKGMEDVVMTNAQAFFVKVAGEPNRYQNDAIYYRSLIFYHKELYQEALDGLKILEQQAKFKEDVQLLMANCLLMLRQYDELQTLADRLLKAGSKDPQIYLLAASTAYERRDYSKANKYFEWLDKEKSTKLDRVNRVRYGYSKYKLKEYSKAIPILEQVAVGQDSLTQAAAYYLGFCYQQEKQNDNALQAYRKAAQEVKGGKAEMAKDAFYQYGKLCFATQNYSDALKVLKELNEKYPNASFAPEVKEMMGEIFSYSKNYPDAISFFENTSLTSTRSKLAYQTACYFYGLDLVRANRNEEGEQYLQKAVESKQDAQMSLAAKYWIAESQYLQQKYPKALAQYAAYQNSEGAKKHEYYLTSLYSAAWCHFEQKKYNEAAEAFISFLNQSAKAERQNLTQKADAEARTGDAYFISKNYNKALTYYQKVIESKQQGVDYAYFQSGECYARQSQYKNAIKQFDKLIQTQPFSDLRDDALDRNAEIYYQWEKLNSKSEAYCLQLVRDFPRSPFAAKAYVRLGLIAYEKSDVRAAVNYLRKVLNDFTYDTENSEIALNNLSSMIEEDEFDVILKEYKLKNPDSEKQLSTLTLNTAKERFYANKFTAAVDMLTNFLSKNPKGKFSIEAYYLRGESYTALGKTDLALKDYEKVYNDPAQNDFSSKCLDAAAKIHYENKDYDKSYALWEQLEKNSSSTENKILARMGMAKSLMAKKSYSNAINLLRTVESDKEADQYLALQASLWIANSQFFLKMYPEAEKTYQTVVKQDGEELGSEAQLMLMRIHFIAKRYQETIDAGKFLKNNFPDSEWKDKAVLWMAEANYELKNLFQAQSMLEELVSKTKSPEIKDYAQKRLEEWKAMQQP